MNIGRCHPESLPLLWRRLACQGFSVVRSGQRLQPVVLCKAFFKQAVDLLRAGHAKGLIEKIALDTLYGVF